MTAATATRTRRTRRADDETAVDAANAILRATSGAFEWTPQRERAAQLIAENELELVEIAAAVGVQRMTLYRWRNADEFAGRVADLQGQIAASALRQTIGKKHRRIQYLQELMERQRAAMDARAARAAADPDAPAEAATGLFESKTVMSASGKTKTDWKFDAQLVREYRQTLEQAARELGQISDKVEVSGETIIRRYVGVDVESV